MIMGTPEYMAPEQAYSADAVDARADIFSLGVMIFEMLAGRAPSAATTRSRSPRATSPAASRG